jgi:hypothetical protein
MNGGLTVNSGLNLGSASIIQRGFSNTWPDAAGQIPSTSGTQSWAGAQTMNGGLTVNSGLFTVGGSSFTVGGWSFTYPSVVNGTVGVFYNANPGYAVCERTDHTIGHCSTVVSSTGACTCN